MKSYLFKIILPGVLALIILGLTYSIGYSSAETKYKTILQEQAAVQSANIASINTLLSTLASTKNTIEADLEAIKGRLAGKTLVVYKDGKCSVTKTFIDARLDAINRANQR